MLKCKIIFPLSIFLFNLNSTVSLLPITRLKIGIKDLVLTSNESCAIYEIRTNYKHLQIIIDNITNIKLIQISDKIPLQGNSNECPTNICSPQNNICQSNFYKKI